MPESTASMYDRSATRWNRAEPILLSDFTARPFLLDWCEPLEGARVLDLGCGEGYVARQLVGRGAREVHGIDISGEMIARAVDSTPDELRGRMSFRVGHAAEASDDALGPFDLVVCVFLFNYLTRNEMQRVLERAAGSLSPGGRLIFSVPHPSLAFLRSHEAPFYFDAGEHGYFTGRDAQFEGEIWRRDSTCVPVRCVHKTFDDYFGALRSAGFRSMPRVKELHVTDEHLELDPAFFGPLRDQPLHVAFQVER